MSWTMKALLQHQLYVFCINIGLSACDRCTDRQPCIQGCMHAGRQAYIRTCVCTQVHTYTQMRLLLHLFNYLLTYLLTYLLSTWYSPDSGGIWMDLIPTCCLHFFG